MKGTLGHFEVSLDVSMFVNASDYQDTSQEMFAYSEMKSFDTMTVASDTLPNGAMAQIENTLSATYGLECSSPEGPPVKNTVGSYSLSSSISEDETRIALNDYDIFCPYLENYGYYQPQVFTVRVGTTYNVAEDSVAQDDLFTEPPWNIGWNDTMKITANDNWQPLTPGVTLRFGSGRRASYAPLQPDSDSAREQ